MILIADVLTTKGQDHAYKIKILEILKGEPADSVLAVKIVSSCSWLPDKGRWIIYARYLTDQTIEIRQCGLSRPISNPEVGPIIKRYLIGNRVKAARRAQRDLRREIDLLRRRKIDHVKK